MENDRADALGLPSLGLVEVPQDESAAVQGGTAVEYAVMLALIIV